jgi:hypothetical protein
MCADTTRPLALIQVEKRIHTLRGEKVILDSDLALLYGVQTKILNRAVKRNAARFPADFMFRLTAEETAGLRRQIGTSKPGRGGARYLPHAFTEHGALMAANVLNSPRAEDMSVYVIRAFIRMRHELSTNEIVTRRLAEIERALLLHDTALRDLFAKIRPLLLPPPARKRRVMGFHA